jgi:hypothetical protein
MTVQLLDFLNDFICTLLHMLMISIVMVLLAFARSEWFDFKECLNSKGSATIINLLTSC